MRYIEIALLISARKTGKLAGFKKHIRVNMRVGLLQFFRIWGSSFSEFSLKKHGFKNSEFLFCYGSSFSDIALLKFLASIFLFLAHIKFQKQNYKSKLSHKLTHGLQV